MPGRKTVVPEARLSTTDWEAAALDAMAEDGLAGVAIEPLARRLGVTKGSFYWHFADRDALLAAALAHWEKGYTDSVIRAVEGLGRASPVSAAREGARWLRITQDGPRGPLVGSHWTGGQR